MKQITSFTIDRDLLEVLKDWNEERMRYAVCGKESFN